MREFLKIVAGLSLGLAAALLIAFNALLLWVATGPRSLMTLTPYISSALEPEDGSYSVYIGETWLIWDGWRHPIDIRLRDVEVLTKGHQHFSSFPEISLGIDVLELPLGRILPTSLTINHPVISLFQNDDHTISFGFRKDTPPATADATPAPQPASETPAAPAEEEISTVPFSTVWAPLVAPDSSSKFRKLHLVTIRDADISIGNVHKGIFFKASKADIIFKRDWYGAMQAVIGAEIAYDTYKSQIDGVLMLNKNSPTIEGDLSFNKLMPGTLAALFGDNSVLSAMRFPVDGKGHVSLDMHGMLQKLAFMIEGGEGSINSDKLDGVIPVHTLHAEGEVSNNLNDIHIKQLTADLGGTLLSADGTVSLSDGDAAIQANYTLKNVLAANMHTLWPPTLSPQSREWVTTNITDGTVTQAEGHFNIPMGDLKKPILPKDDVDVTIGLEGAKIRYLPEHPEMTNVKGSVHVDAVSLSAAIDSAQYMRDTKLTNGKMLIEDLNADNPYIKLDFTSETSARDIVRFLGLPRLKHAARLNLQEDTATGTAKGTASLGFHFFSPKDENGHPIGTADITYDVTAEVKDVSEPGFMKKFDIKDADGTMTVQNSGVEFKGTGDVNGAKITQSDVKYLFTPDKGFDTFIDVTATAPVESLPRFGYPAFPFLKGTLGIKASVKQGDKLQQSQAAFDLTNAAVVLKFLSWSKPDKEPATFELTAETKEGEAKIPTFQLKGKDMNAKGSADLTPELDAIRRVTTDTLVYGNTNLESLTYELIDGGFKLNMKGKSADVTSWVESDPTEPNTFSFEHFPAVQFKADVGHLTLGKGRELSAVKGEITCDTEHCSNVNIAGATMDKKPFSFRILRNPKGQRQLSLHAESAGAFLKATNVFDGMEGGDLTITGNYDDSKDHSVLKARADINEHVIKGAPVLARILSLASLTGFFDTLQGNGIRFTKLSVPFTLSKDVITIEDGKTHGDAMGMTVEGTVTFPKRTLDLQGTIIPSYTLNNVLGKVPLVGTMLTGGEGQGVFAARYSVKGSSDAPDVSVNPLSILTPGFLRGVFDILDTDKKPEPDADENN